MIYVRDDREKEEFMREFQRFCFLVFIYVYGKLDLFKINVQGMKDEIREVIQKI